MFSLTRILGLVAAGALVAVIAANIPASPVGPGQRQAAIGLHDTRPASPNAACSSERFLAALAKLVYGARSPSRPPRSEG